MDFDPFKFADSFKGIYHQEDFEWLRQNRPLLCHYTTVEVLEKILGKNEIWFSNPLFMNDFHEMRLGVNEGLNLFINSPLVIDAAQTPERAAILKESLLNIYKDFEQNHAIDTFVFCLSIHNPQNTDGKLSMWRGYGGQGKGAALVFNTTFITENGSSPLILAKVKYPSPIERARLIEENLKSWCEIVKTANPPNASLAIATLMYFYLAMTFALTTKHKGFEEEDEWRLIYIPTLDTKEILKKNISYHFGSNGVEPKLKFQIEPLKIEPLGTWTFESILEQIILGPSISSTLTKDSVTRMIRLLKPEFTHKVKTSSIPFRTL